MNEGLAATASAALSKQAKAAAKKDISRALKPATAPIKKGLHKARKWFDKATSKVPVLGKFASLPLDVADDLVGGILPEINSRRVKWMKPEFVDHLPEVKTAKQMVVEPNPGPGKKRTKKGKKRSGTRGTAKRNKMLLKYSGIRAPKGPSVKVTLPRRNVRARAVKYRNKRTGKTQSGYKMITSEYAIGMDIAADAQMGQEVIQNGLLMNPHELKLPELNIEVQRWEYYRIKPVITIDGAPVQNVDCALTCYFDPDPTDNLPSDPTTRIEVAEAHGGKPHKVTTMSATWRPSAARGAKVNFTKWFHCDSAGNTGADQRLQNQYRFRMLVYRPPKTYWNGAPVGIALPINIRVRYEIDFKVRTLDNINNATTGKSFATSVSSTSPDSLSTDYLGIGSASASHLLSNYVVDPLIHSPVRYHFTPDGSVYRINNSTLPKYVMVGCTLGAATVTGASSVGSLGNLTQISTNAQGPTTSNLNTFWGLFSVTNTQLQTPTNFLATASYLQDNILAKVSAASYPVGWAFVITAPGTVTTPDQMNLTIIELDEGFGAAKMAWFGPATVQGKARDEWTKIPQSRRPMFGDFVAKFKAKIEAKGDELEYWKRKAQGREFERKEYKLSLTPTPSDDEDDWLAYQQQRAAMHKSPGIIGMKPLKIVQDDEKSERGVPRPKAGSQK